MAQSLFLELAEDTYQDALPLYKTPAEVLTVGLDLTDYTVGSVADSVEIEQLTGQGALTLGTPTVDVDTRGVTFSVSEGRRDTYNTVRISTTLANGDILYTTFIVGVMR